MKSAKITAALALSIVALSSQASEKDLPFRMNNDSSTAICTVIMNNSAMPTRYDYAQKKSLASQFATRLHNRDQELRTGKDEDYSLFNMNRALMWAIANVKEYNIIGKLANGPDVTDSIYRKNEEMGEKFVALQKECEDFARRLKFNFLEVKIPPNSVKWDEKK